MSACAHRGQKRLPKPLEMNVPEAVNHMILGKELSFSVRGGCTFND